MGTYRYGGVKITTQQTPSGRWHASSGYGYADGATEAEALSAIKPKIRGGKKEADTRAKQQAPRKTKRFRVKLATGDEYEIEAFSLKEARDEANRRLYEKRRREGRF